MATSSRHAAARGAAAVLLAAATATTVALAAGSSGPPRPQQLATTASDPAPQALLSALGPRAAPPGWPAATIPSGAATLRHPPGWPSVEGDSGTISFALLDATGRYVAYLNVTPRQGAERPRGWPAFRLSRNREEGDREVRELAARERIHFQGARGSCVIDDYGSRTGANPYRELACIVKGRDAESVIVAAALRPEWPRLAPLLIRSTAAFVER